MKQKIIGISLVSVSILMFILSLFLKINIGNHGLFIVWSLGSIIVFYIGLRLYLDD
jgi:hypothetical protein